MTKPKLWLCLILALTIILVDVLLVGCQSSTPEPTKEVNMPTATPDVPQPCPGPNSPSIQPAADNDEDAGLVRLQQVMAKARHGEKIVVAGLGGSITQGDSVHDDKRYIVQVYDWWNSKYPGQVTLINAGVGATGSGLGTLRIENDLLKENPDLVMVDFAVNDLGMPARQETLEGVVRKILSRPNKPAVILVHFAVKAGDTTQVDFEPIAEHYRIAQVSYRDRINPLIDAGEITLDDVYDDDTHPNDLGQTYTADFIKEYLDSVYENLPADDADIPAIAEIPAPLYADTFQYTQVYHRRNFTPIITGSWKNGYFSRRTGEGWVGDQVGDEMVFEGLPGTAFGVILRKEGDVNFGMAEVWVDDEPPVKIDAFMPSSAGWYGPAAQYHLVAQDLPMTTHTLHVKIIDEKNSETGDNANHVVEIANVFAAGALVDGLADWSYVYTYAGDFIFDIQHANRMDGDKSLVAYNGGGSGEIVWYYQDLTDFEAVLYYPPEGEIEHNVFCVSADGLSWTLASPTVEGGEGKWAKYIYTLNNLTDVSYIKTLWMSAEAALAPELSKVTIKRSGE